MLVDHFHNLEKSDQGLWTNWPIIDCACLSPIFLCIFIYIPISRRKAHKLLKITTIHLAFWKTYYQNVPASVEK